MRMRTREPEGGGKARYSSNYSSRLERCVPRRDPPAERRAVLPRSGGAVDQWVASHALERPLRGRYIRRQVQVQHEPWWNFLHVQAQRARVRVDRSIVGSSDHLRLI